MRSANPSITRRDDRENLAQLSGEDDENGPDFENATSSDEDEDDISDRTEDDHPEIQKVTGCRKTGTRFNSAKGFIYTRHKETKTDIIYICKHQKPKNGGCNARLRQDKVTGIYRKDGRPNHNHHPEKDEQQQLAIVNACVSAALESRDAPRQIFDQIRADLPGNIGYGEAVQRRIQRAKRERQPANPTSVAQADTLLNANPHLGLSMDGLPFYRGLVKAPGDGGSALVFVSSALAEAFANAKDIHADATFRVVPRIFKQLFTIHVNVDGKAYPFAYAIMTRKTRVLYDSVLERVIDVLDEEFPDLVLNVNRSMTDFEPAIQGSLSAALRCETTGCFFHYKQAIWRKAQKCGLQPAYNRRPTITRIIKELNQLALLPADEILVAFQDIKDHYKQILRHETQANQAGVQRLYNYFYSYWIDEVGVNTFSVFGLLDRTNNLLEAWHRWFNGLCQRSHLNFWDFIYNLRRADNQKVRDYLCAINGGETGRPRTLEQERLDAAITSNGDDFANGLLTRREFLELAWKPNNREARPAFHAALQFERRRYLAGTVRPPRNERRHRHHPLPDLPAVRTDAVEGGIRVVQEPAEEQEASQEQEAAQEIDQEPEAAQQPEQIEERRRSSRTLQLPRHLEQFEVAALVRAGSANRNVPAVRARPSSNSFNPVVQRRRGRPAKCRLCNVNKKDASLDCCGYQLCQDCAERIQADDGHCPECNRVGEELAFQLLQ